MRGTMCRSVVVLLLSGALLTTALPSMALGTGGCSSAENGTASAPAGQPALAVDVNWASRDDVMVEYWAVPSWGDGYPQPPAWTGGCTEDAWGVCDPLYPLILTDPGIFGYNTEDAADTYTLMAMVHGACVYANADGQPDNDRVAGVYASIADVPVTAAIRDVAADGSLRQPLVTLSAILPMPPDGATTDVTQWWRELGTFDWDPVSGMSNLRAVSGAGPDVVDGGGSALDVPSDDKEPDGVPATSDSTTAAAINGSATAAAAGASLSRDELFVLGLFLFGVLDDYGLGHLLYGLFTGMLVSAIRTSVDPQVPSFFRLDPTGEETPGPARSDDGLAEAIGSPPPDPASAGARILTELLLDAAQVAASAHHPSTDPPAVKLKTDRIWVSLPAPAVVYRAKAKGIEERTLKTGVWYQMKEQDGIRLFYNKNGKLLGFDSRGEVWFRPWEPKADE